MTFMVALLIKYNDDQKSVMVESPTDRAKASEETVARFGGRKIATYGTVGEFDMLYIYEMPDLVSLTSCLHLVDSSGAAKYTKVLPLMSSEQFFESQKLAQQMKGSYSPISASPDP